MADAEQARRWSEWLCGEGQPILDAGVPASVVRDERRWWDFVFHGTPHYYKPEDEFDVDDLPRDKARKLLRFLEETLEPGVREDSGLVLALRAIVAKPVGRAAK